MKPKDLYDRISIAGAKIGDILTTQKATAADIYIEDKGDRFIKKCTKIKERQERDLKFRE